MIVLSREIGKGEKTIDNKREDLIKNIISGFGGQLIAVALGIVIPRIMISAYGSDVNGVVSTTVQIFLYLALLEAGIGQSARIALYKPISKHNRAKISEVYISAQKYFRKITLYYGSGVVLVSLIAPYVIISEMSYFTIVLIFLLEGISGVISFFYIQTPTIFLNAYGKGYINNNVNLLNRIIGYIVKIVLASSGVDIVLVQFAFFVIVVMKVFFYKNYINKKYPWILQGTTSNTDLLNDKNSFLLTEIAWTIFSSTDMIVLSVFVSASLSSVYSVYNLIYANVSLIINSAGGGVLYILGQLFYKNRDEYEAVHDTMNTVFIGAITVLMSVSYVLTIPFVKLYTNGVADINYVYYQLPLMFSLVQILSWSRYVTGNLTGLAGYAKSTSYISVIEALVNLILSIVLVKKIGMVGVLLATIIALPIKIIWCIYISDIQVLHRSCLKTLKIIGCNYVLFGAIVMIFDKIKIEVSTYSEFVMYSVLLVVILGTAGACFNLAANKQCLKVIKRMMRK